MSDSKRYSAIGNREQSSDSMQPVTDGHASVPKLPVRTEDMKIADYVRQALTNLSQSGYSFSEESIDMMCGSEWTKAVFHTKHPFMKRYIPSKTTNKDEKGEYVRFWSEPYTFGGTAVLVSKEWYKDDFSKFEVWYNTLN